MRADLEQTELLLWRFGRRSLFSGCRLLALLFNATNCLDRQPQTTFVIGFDHFNANVLTDFQHVIDVGDALDSDLRDVKQPITTGQDLNDCTKIKQTQNATLINLANFNISG